MILAPAGEWLLSVAGEGKVDLKVSRMDEIGGTRRGIYVEYSSKEEEQWLCRCKVEGG